MPSIVRGISVENLLSGRRFLIQWDLNPGAEGVTVYKIYRSTTETSGYTQVGQINSPSNQFIDVVPFTFGVVFFYKVIPINSGGVAGLMQDAEPVSDMTFDSFEERPFRVSSVNFNTFAIGEIPSGFVNGINNTFITSSLYRTGSVALYINGLRKTPTIDFQENVNLNTITTTAAPATNAKILVDYLKV